MKLLSLFVIITFISTTAFAEEVIAEEYDYIEVHVGQPVPYDGLLFTYDGISNVVAKIQAKMKLLQIEKNIEIEKARIDLQAKIESKSVELEIKQEMFNKQLDIKQQSINALKNDVYWNKFKLAGSVVAAIATGVIVGYIAAKL